MIALRALAVSFGLFAVVWPQGAVAREPLRLQPSSPWVVDYGDDRCRLIREFGEDATKVTLILSQFEPSDWFRVTVAGKPVEPRSLPPLTGKLRFGPHEQAQDLSALSGEMGNTRALFLIGTYRVVAETVEEKASSERARSDPGFHWEHPPVDPDREAAATSLELTRVLRRDIVLETGTMGKPMAALRECSWDSVRSWNLNVDQQKTLSRKARVKGSSRDWLTYKDYPAKLVESGQQSIVNVRLMIDETGRPISCHIQDSTEPRDFGHIVCRAAMDRAKFEPALDADKQRVPSYLVLTVTFRVE